MTGDGVVNYRLTLTPRSAVKLQEQTLQPDVLQLESTLSFSSDEAALSSYPVTLDPSFIGGRGKSYSPKVTNRGETH